MKLRLNEHRVRLFEGDARYICPLDAKHGPRCESAGCSDESGCDQRTGAKLFLELKARMNHAVVIVDPVWPNAPEGMFPDVTSPRELFRDAMNALPAKPRRLIVILGCNSDPRFLSAVPDLPFVRAVWLRYEIPAARGTVLNSGDIAYVFGDHHAQPGATLIPGEATSKGSFGQGVKGPRGAHPCPRDLDHMRWLVSRLTLPTDLIIDPFAGSGTTLLAAREHGRESIGIEIEKKYCDVAVKKLGQHPLALPVAEWTPRPRHAKSRLVQHRRGK